MAVDAQASCANASTKASHTHKNLSEDNLSQSMKKWADRIDRLRSKQQPTTIMQTVIPEPNASPDNANEDAAQVLRELSQPLTYTDNLLDPNETNGPVNVPAGCEKDGVCQVDALVAQEPSILPPDTAVHNEKEDPQNGNPNSKTESSEVLANDDVDLVLGVDQSREQPPAHQ